MVPQADVFDCQVVGLKQFKSQRLLGGEVPLLHVVDVVGSTGEGDVPLDIRSARRSVSLGVTLSTWTATGRAQIPSRDSPNQTATMLPTNIHPFRKPNQMTPIPATPAAAHQHPQDRQQDMHIGVAGPRGHAARRIQQVIHAQAVAQSLGQEHDAQ